MSRTRSRCPVSAGISWQRLGSARSCAPCSPTPGYVSEENFARAGQDKLRLLAPLAKDPARPGGRPAKRARHLDEYPATVRARRRLRHPRGQEDCKLRSRTVEPVSGQLTTCQKLSTMSRRGLTACQSEWLLACTAHNLRKLHRHRAGG